MTVVIKEASSSNDLKKYIHLPEQLYAGRANWVPAMIMDEWNFRNPNKNKALSHSDTIHFTAHQNGKITGRVMGIINHKHNQLAGEKVVRFYQLDCIEDAEVMYALLNAVEKWGRQNGMTKIIGPYGFSDKDPQGFQIEGFDYLPVIGTPTNPPYLPTLLPKAYSKVIDCVSYQFKVPAEMPETYQKVYNRITSFKKFRIIQFKKKSELRPYFNPVLHLVNETYKPLFGFVPMSEVEMVKLAEQYMPVLDPELVKIIVNGENELVAFVIALPELSRGIQKAKGRLLPFGFWHILSAAKKTHQLNLMLGAIKPSHRGAGLNVLLAKTLFDTARNRHFTSVDSHLILETNSLMRAECERLGGNVYKRYRVYGKILA